MTKDSLSPPLVHVRLDTLSNIPIFQLSLNFCSTCLNRKTFCHSQTAPTTPLLGFFIMFYTKLFHLPHFPSSPLQLVPLLLQPLRLPSSSTFFFLRSLTLSLPPYSLPLPPFPLSFPLHPLPLHLLPQPLPLLKYPAYVPAPPPTQQLSHLNPSSTV